MNNIISYGSIEKIPLYNCSNHVSEEWSELGGRKWPVLGPILMAYGITVDVLYLPILSIMFEKEQFKISCFKIMYLLGITDFVIIYVISILTGWLALSGAVYCSHPTIIYISGMIVCGLWCSSCMTALLLVANRILVMTKLVIAKRLFDGRKTYIILVFPVIYFTYFLFPTPFLFNSKYIAWLYSPMIFPGRASKYFNRSVTANNFSVLTLTCVVYTPFRWIIGSNLKKLVEGQSKKFQNTKNQVLLQSTFICTINQFGALIAVLINVIEVPKWMTMSIHFIWQFVHGSPVIIYLIFNTTIRERFVQKVKLDFLFGEKKKKKSNVLKTVVEMDVKI